jgi:hypothetical protein
MTFLIRASSIREYATIIRIRDHPQRCRSESKKAYHVTSIVTTTFIPLMYLFTSLEKGITITAPK